MKDLISVIVPVFRVEKYLRRCVDSIRSQTYENLEIILVDDGSDDNCPAMCDALQREDPRIRVVHRENGGLSAARNSGIDIAKGKYLAFVDSDDCISPDYVDFLYRTIRETGSQIAQCRFACFRDTPVYDRACPAPRVYDREQMLRNLSTPDMNVCSVVAWTKLYEAQLFRELRYTAGKLHEDEFTTYQVFDRAEKIAYIDCALYGYFENASGITGARIHAGRLDALEAFLERYRYYLYKGYNSLLSVTADHLADNLIRLAGLQKQATDPAQYEKRLKSLFSRIKAEVSPHHWNRHNRLLIGVSRDPAALRCSQQLYLLAGRVSGKLGIGKLRRRIAGAKQQAAYDHELEKVLADYHTNSVLLLGSIEYDNLGDHAIIYAQKKFLEKLAPVIEIRDALYLHTRQQLRKRILPHTLITIPGGGNMGDLWFADEQRRRWILEDFPNNPIVVFPQTISYSDTPEGQQALKDSEALYNSHKNLTLCAREEASFLQMKALYPSCRVLLVPDIVLWLPTMEQGSRKDIACLCFREDAERATSVELRQTLASLVAQKGFTPQEISTVSKTDISCADREAALQAIWKQLLSAQLCVTDRLHGMIFCYLTKTPCVVFDNDNHKIRNTYEKWLQGCDYIFFADRSSAEEKLEAALKCTPGAPVVARELYSQLEEMIQNGQDPAAD